MSEMRWRWRALGWFRAISMILLFLGGGLLFSFSAPLARAQTPAIRVGIYNNEPKVFRDAGGRVSGFIPEILELIAREENWRIEYVDGTWTECLARLEKGKIDVMVDVAYSEERAAKYDFNEESIFVNWGELYTAAGDRAESFLDLAGKKIAVMRGSVHTDGKDGIKALLERFNIEATFVEVDDYIQVFALLDAKQVDAGVVNRLFGNLFQGDYNITRSSIIFNPSSLRFAFPRGRPGNAQLIERIDYHLRRLKRDPASEFFKIIDRNLTHRATGTPEATIVSLTDEEKEWIRQHPVIRLGIDPEFVPFEFIDDNGRYSGLASDYIALLNKRLGLNMIVQPGLTWKEAAAMARTGELDVLPCVGINKERQEYLDFSMSYINFQRVIITRTDEPFIVGLGDLRDRIVAVQANSSHEGFLRDNTQIEPKRYATLEETLMAVSSGQADAMIGNVSSAVYWIRRLSLTNLKVAAPASSEIHTLHFAVRKDWPILVRIINKGLSSITAAERDQIRDRWVRVSSQSGINAALVWKYVTWALIGIGAVFIFFLAWNYRLKKEIMVRQHAEKRLEEQTRELERANKRLMELDRMKSMFMASMSHELRTPLNSIIGFTGLLLMDMAGPVNAEQRKQLGMVKSSAEHLLTLINDILDISKIESGRIQFEKSDFEMEELFEEVANTVRPMAEKKGLALAARAPGNLEVRSDRRRLKQVLINLAGNAVKFTEKGSVSIEARRDGDRIVIVVADTGPGIRAEEMENLFQPFQQLDMSSTKKYEGTGLGLYLSRKIMNLLGGTIVVESVFGEGSRFFVALPAEAEKGDVA